MVVRRALQITALLLIGMVVFQQCLAVAGAQDLVNFELVSYDYASAAGTAEIYPGSKNVALRVYLLYSGQTSIHVSAGCLNTQPWFRISRGWQSCTSPTSPNGTALVTVNPGDIVVFEYRIDVNEDTSPGLYDLNITLYYRIPGSTEYQQFTLSGVVLRVSEYPPIEVEVVGWWWRPAGYPGSEGVSLYLNLRNKGRTLVYRADGVARFEPIFAVPCEFSFQIANLDVNATVSIVLGPLNINSSAQPDKPYSVVLELNATLRTVDGVLYSSRGELEIEVFVSQPPKPSLDIVDYGLTAIKPTGNVVLTRLYITLLNRDFRPVRGLIARFELLTRQAWFANGSTWDIVVYEGTLPYGATATILSSPLVISGAPEIPVKVSLLAFGDENGAEFWVEIDYFILATVVEPDVKIVVVDTYWSSIPAYATTQTLTFNVVLMNYDVVSVRDAVATLELPGCFYPGRITLSGIAVGSGEMVTISFTGISVERQGDCQRANLTIRGVAFDVNTGAFFEFQKSYALNVKVDNMTTRQGLRILDVGWLNKWPLYPYTENATLTVLLANFWPYQIASATFELLLPQGFYGKNGNRSSCEYIGGPIAPYQEITLNFEISVGDVSPGLYAATLRARYVVLASPMLEFEEEFQVALHVSSLEDAITIVGAYWVGKAPEPPEHGVVLQVTVRNNRVPSMRGLILELDLPAGILSADTNSSKAMAVATNIDLLQRIQPVQQLQPPITAEILETLIRQVSPAPQGVSQGDLAYFYLKLNILANEPGIYRSTGYLNFIDHWGNTRKIPVEVQIAVLGSTKIIRVHAPTTIEIKRGTASLDLGLENVGISPVFDVYVYVYPQVPVLIPVEAVKYTSMLPPGKIVNTTLTLVYNPIGAMVSGVQTYLRYTAVPFVVTIVYKDVHGYTRVLNTTFALLVEPFIDLVLSATQAYIARRELTISGVLSNVGLATARSVVIKAVYGNTSKDMLIGDVDPGSQTAFRLELGNVEFESHTAELYVYYRDEYGRVKVLVYEVPVVATQVEEAPITLAKQPALDYTYITLAVVVFLGIVAIAIYRYLKAHSRKLEKLLTKPE